MTSNKHNYSLYKTLDNSYTLKNHQIDENYHSNAGAFQEADLKYFDGCKILEKSNVKALRVFEVGFGLGYNLLPFFKQLQSFKYPVEYISTEYDTQLFKELLNQIGTLYPKEFLNHFKCLLQDKVLEYDNFKVRILDGDVRKSIKHVSSNSIDAIFHDPFSPYKNTECWTQDFFSEEYRILKDDGILSTYSISTPVRSGMFQAGFNLWEGIGDETKSSGTIGSKTEIVGLTSLPEKMIRKMDVSPERIPFRDKDLTDTKDTIKNERMRKKELSDYSDCVRFVQAPNITPGAD